MIKRNAVTVALLATGTAISPTGCGSGAAGTASVQDTQARETVLDYFPDRSPEGETYTVVDHMGREIEISVEINHIVISSLLSLPSVCNLFEGSAEELVGIHPSSMVAAENLILPKVAPGVLDVNTGFLQGGELDIEELLDLKPDVVFYSTNDTEKCEKLTATGIPAVGFSTSNRSFDCVAVFGNWAKLLGKTLDQEDEATGITDYGRQVCGEVQTVLNGAGDIEKPRVLTLLNHASGVIKTSGSNFLGQYWIESTGDISVAAGLTGTPEINVGQICEWNPDTIYITNFSPHLPEDPHDNTIEGHDWSSVKMVKEGKVRKSLLGMYRWFPPAPDTPLVLRWLVQKNQPQLFVDVDMEQEVRTYYERLYNAALSGEDITQIFNPAREAAGN